MEHDAHRRTQSTTASSVLGKRDRTLSTGDGGGDGASPGDRTPTKYFRCADCDKSYSRVDHLARHVRQHTQERPYICGECHKGFARADLLKRHASVHSTTDGTGSVRKPNRQGRVNQACLACAELHLKCDNEKPCQRCKAKSIYCQYQSRQADDEAVAHDLLSLSQQQVQTPDLSRTETTIPHHTQQVPRFVPAIGQSENQSSNHYSQNSTTPALGSHPQPPPADMPHGYSTLNNDFEGTELRDFLQNVMGQPPAGRTAGTQFGAWTPRNLFELGLNTDLELNDVDKDLLADYSLNNPFGVSPDHSSSGTSGDAGSEPPMSGIELMQKASTWRFRPASRDNRDNNLSLPSGSTRRLVIARRITKQPLSYVTRDLILSLMASARYHRLQSPTSATLPSVELLDSLLQFYLASVPASEQFVHTPTYEPSNARPELTAALLAAGAVLTPDKHLRKLGFAVQEAVRGAIAVSLESDNTLIRNLEIVQSSLFTLSLGLWSGNSRKMEIAESFGQVFITMIRRGGWFRAYDHELPEPDDQGSALEAKWRRWAEQESKKRLVFAYYKHDAATSITQFINPVISYADLHLPLPYPHDLWTASSAQAWKDLYLSRYQSLQTQPPSVVSLMRRVDQFGGAQSITDDHVAIRALMCSSWGMVREYRQQNAIVQGMQSHWSGGSLLLASRLAEIRSLLDYLRMIGPTTADSALFLEIQSMHLYISLEDVHVFAGIEGQDEARRAYPSLLDWARTPGARQAVHHAGQLIRYAAQIPFIRNFEAVAVYQAGLTLWAYGVISNAILYRGLDPNSAPRPNDEFIAINGPDDQATQRFLTLNRGTPGLAPVNSGGNDRVLLANPDAVMLRLVNLLRASHRSTNSVPPLIENLTDLMNSLGAAVRSLDNTQVGPVG